MLYLNLQERDKLFLARSIIFELVQAMKFKIDLPDDNLLMLVQVRVLVFSLLINSVSTELWSRSSTSMF